jgi:superfamily II DNA or RNA helicase
MAEHDIIDNRTVKLVDHLQSMLSTSEQARFAVGYLFVSGLAPLAKKLLALKDLRLLIGNTTNRDTVEMMAEGYKRIDLAAKEVERQSLPKRVESAKIADDTAGNLRNAMELMDQTDEAEEVVGALIRMIQEGRMKVRIYTQGRLHAKAYICSYGGVFDASGNPQDRPEKGIAVVGSSNLSLAGISHNTELNVVVQGNANHAALVKWFDDLWNEAQEFDAALMNELRSSWAAASVRPYDIYLKALYALVRDRLELDEEQDVLWDDLIFRKLATFQKVAVRQAAQIIRDHGGAFVSDVVGLGKSFIGAAIVKHFERSDHARALIVCPAPLTEMWERYNETYELNAQVLSMGFLREDDDVGVSRLLKDPKYKDRDFVLLDESHNLRHSDTQRYKVLQTFMSTGRRTCFLTATPRNKSAWDIYHQIKLFHQEDPTALPIDPPDLRAYFKLVEKGERQLPVLLSHILIRRTRNHIVKWYGFDAETHEPVNPDRFDEYLSGQRRAYVLVAGKHQFFPKRELETVSYSIEETYQGLYQRLRKHLGAPNNHARTEEMLTYARYGLWNYVKPEKQKKEPYVSLQSVGSNLRGLMRVLMFKRFESSVYAFQQTVGRLIRMHRTFLEALDKGFVPAGEDAQALLYESDRLDQTELFDALRNVSKRYDAADFNVKDLRQDIGHDLKILESMSRAVEKITPDKDAKLAKLSEILAKKPLKGVKQLIFTQFADTAQYLYDNLNPGGKRDDVDVIYSGDKSKEYIVGRFAPKANPESRGAKQGPPLMTLVATDVLAEGLNLQDCDNIINYDLHWNPVRLIQRFGRIDRVGSDHEKVYAFNFLPELGIEQNLGLHQILHNRIQEIHDTIGEDSKILDETERLNPEAMYAIYEPKSGPQLSLWGEEKEELLDLGEAEEMMRQLRKDDPVEYQHIVDLRDGIRTARAGSSQKGMIALCQAGRYQQLMLIDQQGAVISKEIPRVLSALMCAPETPSVPLPAGYNAALMKVLASFADDVRHREAGQSHRFHLSHGQLYVLRELRILFDNSDDEEMRSNIAILEQAFRGTLTGALKRELGYLRKNGSNGSNLYTSLAKLYNQHGLRDAASRIQMSREESAVPRVVCSEGLV